MQNVKDQSVAFDYAHDLAEYGGMYHEGDQLIVLFTAKLAEHEAALRSRVSAPDLISIAPAPRTFAEVERAREQAQAVLLDGPESYQPVQGVGLSVFDGHFAVVVTVDDDSGDVADRVRAATAPEEVHIRLGGAIHRLVAGSTTGGQLP